LLKQQQKQARPKYVGQPIDPVVCNREQLLKKTMDLAIDRYQQGLQKIRAEKQIQLEDFHWRVQAEQQLIEQEQK
jgi:hypothetical protein